MRLLSIAIGAICLITALPLDAQVAPPQSETRIIGIDSGPRDNPTDREEVVFSELLSIAGATWMRLHVLQSNLPQGSFLRVTSLRDGAVQRHTSASLLDYGNSTAFFNGDKITIELIAAPNSSGNRVAFNRVELGRPMPTIESICGTDTRIPSTDPRVGRLSSRCTGWLIGPVAGLSAGHCGGNNQILELNVPPSSPSGQIVRAHPDDQYPFSLFNGNRLNNGVGADWAVFHAGRNSNTNLLPAEANGRSWFSLGTIPNAGTTRITGYGLNNTVRTQSEAQQTGVGGRVTLMPGSPGYPNALGYLADTTGGNSGSPVIHDPTGRAIGIHTHGGCSPFGGNNWGTRLDRQDLATAIRQANIFPGSATTFGSACAGSNGTPTLSFSGLPEINQTLTVEVRQAALQQMIVLMLGRSNTDWMGAALPIDLNNYGAPGCNLYISFEAAMAAVTSSGSADFQIPIPADSFLVGDTTFVQAFFCDPGNNALNMAVTNAGEVFVGN